MMAIMRGQTKQYANIVMDKGKVQWLSVAYHIEQLLESSWASTNLPCYFGSEVGSCTRHYKSAPLQERKMVDRRRIHVKGGDGGDGCTSFRKSRQTRYSEADGGRGGKGGDVIFKCSVDVWDFGHLQYHINGEKGGVGSSKRKIGTRGQDKIIRVPVGTVIHMIRGEIPSLADAQEEAEFLDDDMGEHRKGDVRMVGHNREAAQDMEDFSSDDDNGSKYEGSEDEKEGTEVEVGEEGLVSGDESNEDDNEDRELSDESSGGVSNQVTVSSIAELLKPGETLMVASGGEGGRGNAAMARGRGAEKKLPSRTHEYGRKGTEAFLVLELKTIADVGLVGAPNAGKSTLLGAISRAKPKVGHYAFTTLRPNLGKLEFDDYFSITVADIPGLIKGAHKNVGLGHDFLRHIERTKVLAYVVDLAAGYGDSKGTPPWDQVEELKFELEKYQPGLSVRPSLVVGTKLDERGAKEQLQELQRRLPSAYVVPVCALLEQGIHELRLALREIVCSPER